jgi:hypothetical protein
MRREERTRDKMSIMGRIRSECVSIMPDGESYV